MALSLRTGLCGAARPPQGRLPLPGVGQATGMERGVGAGQGGVSNGCYKSKIYMCRHAATSQVPISPASIIPGSRRLVRATAGTTRNLSKGGRVHGPSREDIQSMSKTRRRFDKLHLRSFCMIFFYPSLRRTSRIRMSDGGWRGWSALCPAV